MPRFLPFLFFCLFIQPVCQAQTKPDSVKIRLAILEAKVKKDLQELQRKNDTLTGMIKFYRAKEDYYTVAIANQATIFLGVLSLIAVIAGLISFSSWKQFDNRIRENRQLVKDSKDLLQNEQSKAKSEITDLIFDTKKDIESTLNEIRLEYYRDLFVLTLNADFLSEQNEIDLSSDSRNKIYKESVEELPQMIYKIYCLVALKMVDIEKTTFFDGQILKNVGAFTRTAITYIANLKSFDNDTVKRDIRFRLAFTFIDVKLVDGMLKNIDPNDKSLLSCIYRLRVELSELEIFLEKPSPIIP